MKILLGADQYPEHINGAATFTVRLAEGLAAARHRVDLVWPSADGEHRTGLQGGIRVHRLSSVALPGPSRIRVSAPLLAARQVEDLLDAVPPDVVHVQSHLGVGRALVRGARLRGVPVLATNHFMPENILPHVPLLRRFPRPVSRLAWWDVERVFAGADLVCAPTRRAVDLLARSTRLPDAEVISCGVDLDRFQPPAVVSPAGTAGTLDGPTALFVGRLEPEKHVDELLRAFARLPRSLAARLEVVGSGSLRPQLEAQSHALGLDATVRFRGAISDDDLARTLAAADLFAMPGTAELQSLATLEAMAAGLPVVAADAMALPHLVHDDENGYLYTPGDVAGLAARLCRLLADAALRDRLGRASRVIAEGHAFGATLAAYEMRYRALVAGPTPALVEEDLTYAA